MYLHVSPLILRSLDSRAEKTLLKLNMRTHRVRWNQKTTSINWFTLFALLGNYLLCSANSSVCIKSNAYVSNA